MLSRRFQEDIPANMFVYPARTDAGLPPDLVRFSEVPEEPAVVDAARVGENLERWLDEWTDTVLR